MTDDASPLLWLEHYPRSNERQSWTMDTLAEQRRLQITFENATKHAHKVSLEQITTKLFLREIIVVAALMLSCGGFIAYCTAMSTRSDILLIYSYIVELASLRFLIRFSPNVMNMLRTQIATTEQSRFCEWLVHSGGIYDHSSIRQFWGKRVTFFAWAQLKEPGITKYGDVFVLRNHFWYPTYLYLPRTAFRNMESAKRFHAALVLLWKTNGDLDAVSEEVLEEFAPDRSYKRAIPLRAGT